MVKQGSTNILLASVTLFDLKLDQMDLKTTFFYGKLEEKILPTLHEVFEVKGKKDHIYLLKKYFYGQKQSPM